jgi:hypothetical protein
MRVFGVGLAFAGELPSRSGDSESRGRLSAQNHRIGAGSDERRARHLPKQVTHFFVPVPSPSPHRTTALALNAVLLVGDRMVRINAQMAMATVGLGMGVSVFSLFGMNLRSSFEAHPQMFWLVAGAYPLLPPPSLWLAVAHVSVLCCCMHRRWLLRRRPVVAVPEPVVGSAQHRPGRWSVDA